MASVRVATSQISTFEGVFAENPAWDPEYMGSAMFAPVVYCFWALVLAFSSLCGMHLSLLSALTRAPRLDESADVCMGIRIRDHSCQCFIMCHNVSQCLLFKFFDRGVCLVSMGPRRKRTGPTAWSAGHPDQSSGAMRSNRRATSSLKP